MQEMGLKGKSTSMRSKRPAPDGQHPAGEVQVLPKPKLIEELSESEGSSSRYRF
jgi:hypothetical protein